MFVLAFAAAKKFFWLFRSLCVDVGHIKCSHDDLDVLELNNFRQDLVDVRVTFWLKDLCVCLCLFTSFSKTPPICRNVFNCSLLPDPTKPHLLTLLQVWLLKNVGHNAYSVYSFTFIVSILNDKFFVLPPLSLSLQSSLCRTLPCSFILANLLSGTCFLWSPYLLTSSFSRPFTLVHVWLLNGTHFLHLSHSSSITLCPPRSIHNQASVDRRIF